jgi:ABC-2 type transport system permease protein
MSVLFVFSLNAYEATRRAAAQQLQQVPGADVLVRDIYGGNAMWALIFIVPLVTMRLLAEERRQHTAELLLTAPMTTRQLVLGKFFGAAFILALMLVLIGWMPLVLRLWGDADPAPIWTGILGVFLYGGFLLAIGLLASSLTESAFVAAIVALGLLVLVNWGGVAVGQIPIVGPGLEKFTPVENLKTLVRGTIETRAIVYFVSMTMFVVDLTARVVDSQRWR